MSRITTKLMFHCRARRFCRDHQGRRRLYVEVTSGVTNRLHRFTYDDYVCVARNREVDVVHGVGIDDFVWDPTEPIATRPLMCDLSGDGTLFYCHDGNKNVSEAVTLDGTIAAHYEYSAFGKVVLVTSESEDQTTANLNPYQFSSEHYDGALGLVYYNYRHYNLKDGRWIGRDLIEETGGVSLYAFVGNAAVGGFDHSGRIAIGGIAAGVAVAALVSRITHCYYAVIDSAGDYGNRDGYAHCVVACNFNNCMGGALGKLGRIGSSAITLLGAVLWEVVSGWEKDAENDIRSGYNGVKGSIAGKPCPDACKCEENNMPSLR